MTIRDVEDAVPYDRFCIHFRYLRNAEGGVPYDRFRLRIKKGKVAPTMGLFARFNKKITFLCLKITLAISDI